MIWPEPNDLLLAGSKLFLDMILARAPASMGKDHIQLASIDPSVAIDKIVT